MCVKVDILKLFRGGGVGWHKSGKGGNYLNPKRGVEGGGNRLNPRGSKKNGLNPGGEEKMA